MNALEESGSVRLPEWGRACEGVLRQSRGAVLTGLGVPRSLGWFSYHLQSDSIPCQKRLGRIAHLTCEKKR